MEAFILLSIFAGGINVAVIVFLCCMICKREGPCAKDKVLERQHRRQHRMELRRQQEQAERRLQRENPSQERSRSRSFLEEQRRRLRNWLSSHEPVEPRNTENRRTSQNIQPEVRRQELTNNEQAQNVPPNYDITLDFDPACQLPSYEDVLSEQAVGYQENVMYRVNLPPRYEDVVKEDGTLNEGFDAEA